MAKIFSQYLLKVAFLKKIMQALSFLCGETSI